MARIKHQLFTLSKTGIAPVEGLDVCEDLSSAASQATEPGTYVVLPVLIINPKSKNDGKKESLAGVDANNNQGEAIETEASNGKVDKPNKASKQGNKGGKKR
jgi:hypothetical protein